METKIKFILSILILKQRMSCFYNMYSTSSHISKSFMRIGGGKNSQVNFFPSEIFVIKNSWVMRKNWVKKFQVNTFLMRGFSTNNEFYSLLVCGDVLYSKPLREDKLWFVTCRNQKHAFWQFDTKNLTRYFIYVPETSCFFRAFHNLTKNGASNTSIGLAGRLG